HARVVRTAEIDEQAVERLERQAFAGMRNRVLDELDPLFGREQRLLALVHRDRDDRVIEQAQRALEDVEVAVRDRIERAGIHGERRDLVFHVATLKKETIVSPYVRWSVRSRDPSASGGT